MTSVISTSTTQQNPLTELLKTAQQLEPTQPWLNGLRQYAAARVQEQSFPTTRQEEWRFTDLSPLKEIDFAVQFDAASPNLNSHFLPETLRLVFVNGEYAADLSDAATLPKGLFVGSLSTLPEAQADRVRSKLAQQQGAEEVFTALNTAGLRDAAIVWVNRNVAIDTPIHLIFVTTDSDLPLLVQPRCLVVAESSSAVAIVEEYLSASETVYFTNAVTEVWVDDNAEVNHTRIQTEANSAFHIGKTAASQARDSRYTCTAISLGGRISRHHLEIYQTGTQTQTTLNGLTSIHGQQLADTHSTLSLTHPYGTSRQIQKCIVDDQAHGVFNGKVFVPKAAQLTDAGQLNQNLLLSPKARVDTKPQLEIVADNVKCTHGATVGQLDADEVFYLQSRGIDRDSARRLLIYAFAYDILDRIPIAALKDRLTHFFH